MSRSITSPMPSSQERIRPCTRRKRMGGIGWSASNSLSRTITGKTSIRQSHLVPSSRFQLHTRTVQSEALEQIAKQDIFVSHPCETLPTPFLCFRRRRGSILGQAHHV